MMEKVVNILEDDFFILNSVETHSSIGLGFFEYNVPAKTGKRHRLLYAVRKQ